MASPRSRVAEILLKTGVIDELQLRSALAHQGQWGGRLSKALVELGLAEESAIADAVAEGCNLPRLRLAELPKDGAALARVPVAFAESKGVFPVSLKDHAKTLVLACSDPSDLTLLDEASGVSRARIQLGIAGEEEIARAIAKHYRNVDLLPAQSRARAAVERSQRHTSDESPAVEYPTIQASEQEFSAESLGAEEPSATDMLDEMMAGSRARGSIWTDADHERLKALIANQQKGSMVLDAVLALLVDKGFLRPSAYQAWRRGETLPGLPQLRPPR